MAGALSFFTAQGGVVALLLFRQPPGSGGKEGEARARVAFSALLLSLVALCLRAVASLPESYTDTNKEAGGGGTRRRAGAATSRASCPPLDLAPAQ